VQGIFYTSEQKGNKMLDIDEIQKHLQYMVLSRVAYETGVDRGTLIRIKSGLSKRPSHSTIKALSEFLQGLRNDE
jgi:transcriptional regulator with XRE-family HTH domain